MFEVLYFIPSLLPEHRYRQMQHCWTSPVLRHQGLGTLPEEGIVSDPVSGTPTASGQGSTISQGIVFTDQNRTDTCWILEIFSTLGMPHTLNFDFCQF